MPLTVQSVEFSLDFLGETREDVVYTVADKALWERFQSKWLVPKEGYGFILGWTGESSCRPEVLQVLTSIWSEKILESLSECNSQPKIQGRTLLDLPNEILHLIFRRIRYIDAARRLSATCHRLHGVSLPYIYLVSFSLLGDTDILIAC